jgi:hypothetical protein
MDHWLDVKDDTDQSIALSSDDDLLVGVSYGKYQVINAYRDEHLDGISGPLVFSASDRYVGRDGYVYASAGYSSLAEPFLVLSGADVFIYIIKKNYEEYQKYINVGYGGYGGTFLARGPEVVFDLLNGSPSLLSDFAPGIRRDGVFAYWDDGIKSIKAWSTLIETVNGEKVVYGAERMRHPFYDWGDMLINYNNGSLFWAEGEAGSGIGGTIDIELDRTSDSIYVLNGAVDLSRRYLYKANNRLKRILVSSTVPRFSIEYVFEDIVEFQEIRLPCMTSKVSIKILEVFKGEKFDDTCVSKIFLPQRAVRPQAEYQDQVLRYVQLPEIRQAIAEYEKREKEQK